MVWILEKICLPNVKEGSDEYKTIKHIAQLCADQCQDKVIWDKAYQQCVAFFYIKSPVPQLREYIAIDSMVIAADIARLMDPADLEFVISRTLKNVERLFEDISREDISRNDVRKTAYQSMMNKLIELLQQAPVEKI